METPRTRTANVFRVGVKPTLPMSTETQPSASGAPASGKPAGMAPSSGMSTMRLRSLASGEVTRSDRVLPESEAR